MAHVRRVAMVSTTHMPAMHGRLVEALYVDAMILADEARHYAQFQSPSDVAALDPLTGVLVACESLRLTTRLTHLLGWLLSRRPEAADDLPQDRLMPIADTAADIRRTLPDQARVLIATGEALYRRAEALDRAIAEPPHITSPARAMQQRLRIDLYA
jgi:regulator of CtrA degradation